ncbi:PDZ/DHR/GLGF domain protein, partial [Paragonimus heterotremus]
LDTSCQGHLKVVVLLKCLYCGERVLFFCTRDHTMSIKKILRKYVSNIISFTNAHTRNSLRDRSSKYYAGEVTPELEELMRKVWQPLIEPDQEIIVLHIKKPKSAVSLGISIEGVDEVRKPEFRSSVPGVSVLPNGGSNERKSIEPRHFVQAVVPNGLIGSLNIVRPGDELLQVNGRRLRGTSSTNTVRCLRSLPQYIELVLARSKSGDPVPTIPGVDASWAFADEPPFELQASEVNSVDTTYSASPIAEVTAPYPMPVSPKTAHNRVSEWVRRSVTEQPDGSISTDADVNRTQSPEAQSNYVYPANIPPYPADKNAIPLEATNSVTRAGRDGLFESSGATLPRSYPAYLQDPRYGSKRPVWSTVPLLVQLNKSSSGFG